MDQVWTDLFGPVPWTPETAYQLARIGIQLLVAVFLGSILGFERQYEGKVAGMRTHMMVALGAAVFVMVPMEAGVPLAMLSQVIQGIAAGIGFLGAGAILKVGDQKVEGLTTAAGIWMTAAIGLAVGARQLWLAILGTAAAWGILFVVHYFNRAIRRLRGKS